jgi:hypothetical protein
VLLLLLTACSGTSATPTPTPTPTPTMTESAAAPTTTSAPTTSAPPAATGPVGGPVPKGFTPRSVTFVSSSTGWALGDATCSKPPCTSVVRTRDGGRTWRGIPAPVAWITTDDGHRSTSQLRFANLLDGFAYRNDLFTTHDGGARWHRVPVDGRVSDLEVGSGRWWAVVDGCDAVEGTCATAGKVISGAVGSDRFRTEIALAAGESGEVVLHGARVYLALWGNDPARTDPHLRVGPAFARRSVPCTQDELPALAASADSGLALVCHSVDAAAGTQPKRAFTSADSGRHWNRVGDPPHVSGTSVAATHRGTFVANERTGVDVTRDGARTWVTCLRREGASYIGFVDDAFGVVLAEDTLFLTRDAGHTWEKAAF